MTAAPIAIAAAAIVLLVAARRRRRQREGRKMDESQGGDNSNDIQEDDIVALGEGPYEGFDAKVLSIDRLNGTAVVYVYAFGPPDSQVVKLSSLQKHED